MTPAKVRADFRHLLCVRITKNREKRHSTRLEGVRWLSATKKTMNTHVAKKGQPSPLRATGHMKLQHRQKESKSTKETQEKKYTHRIVAQRHSVLPVETM
jgi:hypothetical protein